MNPKLSYVLPVHNQERVLEESVRRLRDRLRAFPGSEVLLIENASSDTSPAICARLATAHGSDTVPVRAAESARGMGSALRRGIALAAGDVLVLTAADLPFGFTDLDAYLACDPRPGLAIGSKAHARSRTRIPLQRRVMSEAFRLLRLALLGLRVRDSQGTILIDAALARAVAPQLRCEDYLISTEIVSWASALGHTPVELPVTYSATGSSTVSPVRDSLHMARGLLALRGRLR
ncbi:MAG: glycosyltransferase [Candidatus Dormibacteria bacterium]